MFDDTFNFDSVIKDYLNTVGKRSSNILINIYSEALKEGLINTPQEAEAVFTYAYSTYDVLVSPNKIKQLSEIYLSNNGFNNTLADEDLDKISYLYDNETGEKISIEEHKKRLQLRADNFGKTTVAVLLRKMGGI